MKRVVSDQTIAAEGLNEMKMDNKVRVVPCRGPQIRSGPGPPKSLRCPCAWLVLPNLTQGVRCWLITGTWRFDELWVLYQKPALESGSIKLLMTPWIRSRYSEWDVVICSSWWWCWVPTFSDCVEEMWGVEKNTCSLHRYPPGVVKLPKFNCRGWRSLWSPACWRTYHLSTHCTKGLSRRYRLTIPS